VSASPRLLAVLLVASLAASLSGCGGPAASTASAPPAAGRPSSPAVISITSPQDGALVTGDVVHVVVSLEHARIVAATSTHIQPDEGHVHLYLDNSLVTMQYALAGDVPVTPGSHALRAEFVASDHFPFDPRVWSQTVVFTVQ
jgi:hypothetical protein